MNNPSFTLADERSGNVVINDGHLDDFPPGKIKEDENQVKTDDVSATMNGLLIPEEEEKSRKYHLNQNFSAANKSPLHHHLSTNLKQS